MTQVVLLHHSIAVLPAIALPENVFLETVLPNVHLLLLHYSQITPPGSCV